MLVRSLEYLLRVLAQWQAPDLSPLHQLRQAIRRSVVERRQTTSRIWLSEALLRSTIRAAQFPALHRVCPRQARFLRQVVRHQVVGLARHLPLANTALRLKAVLLLVTVLLLLRLANTELLRLVNTALLRRPDNTVLHLRPDNTARLHKADNSVVLLKAPQADNTALLKAGNTVARLKAEP